MVGSIKGIIVEIGGDTSGLQKALSKVNSTTSNLSKELRGINSLLKLDPSNTELIAQKQKVLAENIENTEKKLEELKKAQELADDTIRKGGEISQENYRKLQREIISTEEKLKQLKVEASNWTTAGKSIEEFGNKVTNISNKINKLGTTLTTTLTLPILGLTTAAINASKEFETAFTGVEKTVDGTAEQMEKLKQGIKNMAEEIPSSTTEISAVAEAAGQLGIQTENILSFSKAMIDLGNSTNLTADEAASQLAKFANITEMSQKDFEKLGSAVVDLGNNFATTEVDIVNMAMRLAGAGHQVGFSEGEILGLATALSSVGIEAEMGGSAISKAMVKMQNAVELGGNKLQNVLKKTGKSLKDLELLSANNSKAFKELSDGIGMTSTEVKQLITAGTNLEDFANVSGMTADQFKKAWKEDASGALSAFIKGLGDAESKGESAITMLSEMGLTEVRLRDSLLRAANAGNLFNDAIKTGTNAWEENTALMKEANKRYATLDSRLKMTKNKISNVATTTGDKLTPTFNKLLDKVDELVDEFGDLNEEEITNIIKTAALVASIGPAIKIFGTLETTVGKVSKGIGQFSQAIAVVKNNTTSSVTSVNNLATAIKLLSSPMGIMTAAIIAGTTAMIAYEDEQQKSLGNSRETKKAIEEEIDSRNKLIEKQQEQVNSGISEIARTQELYNELKTITDENGKIKEGYEKRANYIINELSNALDIEISKNGNIIENYQAIQSEIDKLIVKKKAELILEKQEETYTKAIQSRGEAYIRLEELQNSYTEAMKQFYASSGREQMEAKKAMIGLQYQLEQQQALINGYNTDIATYESNYSLMCEGTTEALNKLVDNTEIGIFKQTNDTYNGITKQIEYYTKLTEDYKRLKDEQLKKGDEYRANEYNQQEESNRKQLEQLSEQLAQITTETNIKEPEIETAWKNIANNSNTAFFNIISLMPENLRNQLLRISEFINEDVTIENASKQLGEDADNSFRSGMKLQNGKIAAEDYMAGAQQGLNNKKSAFYQTLLTIGQQGNANMRKGLGDGSPSKLAKQALIDYFLGADIGIKKQGNKTIKNIKNMRL